MQKKEGLTMGIDLNYIPRVEAFVFYYIIDNKLIRAYWFELLRKGGG